jgi:TRAP-type C4-dicarboxylate transport system permease small subunit
VASSAIERGLRAVSAAATWLVLPLSLLLFLQWPLRELVQGFSREANDLAQVLFAIYVAVAITEATRRRTHLAADAFAQRFAPRWRARLARAASAAVLVPWAAFVLYAAAVPAWRSALQLERFPETLDPGYFLIRAAVLLLALLVLAQALVDLAAREPPG